VHLFGARATQTWTDGARSDRDFGLVAAIRHFDYTARSLFSARSVGSAFIGGGTAGFEGGLSGTLSGGLRAPLGKHHGAVARVGLDGYLIGNRRFYTSLLELPQGQLGYQILTGDLLVELAGTMGPVLTGRHRALDAGPVRLTKMLETGALLAAGLRTMHLELTYARYERGDAVPERTIDRLSGSLCGITRVLALCADTQYFRWAAAPAANPPPSVAYLGLHVGIRSSPVAADVRPVPPRTHRPGATHRAETTRHSSD
jgi:hypothetical protein